MGHRCALLLVDLQDALCRGRWAAFEAPALLMRLDAAAASARAAGVVVVWIQHEEAEGPLAPGGPGWQLDASLHPEPQDLRVRKTACDAFFRTPLHPLLQQHGVQRVVIGGLQTEFCVDSTVRGALAHGYPTVLLADGHGTLDTEVLRAPQIVAHHNLTLGHVGNFGPAVAVRTVQAVVDGGWAGP